MLSKEDVGKGGHDRRVKGMVGRARRLPLRTVVIGAILLAVLGAFIAVAVVDNMRKAASAPREGVESFGNLSRNHTQNPVSYGQTPPVGGDHYPVWQDQGFYEEPVPNEKAVHTLEHGAVWITYSPDLPQEQKEKLRQVVKSQDRSIGLC